MAMITSLGIGSGLDLNGLADQLRTAERQKLAPSRSKKISSKQKFRRLAARLESALDRFKGSVAALNDTKLFSNQKSSSSNETVKITASLLLVA